MHVHHLLFFFNDTATTEIYTLSLHDALPISGPPPDQGRLRRPRECPQPRWWTDLRGRPRRLLRSEEHTSELQSRQYLVCRLLLEKKNNALIKLVVLLPLESRLIMISSTHP